MAGEESVGSKQSQLDTMVCVGLDRDLGVGEVSQPEPNVSLPSLF